MKRFAASLALLLAAVPVLAQGTVWKSDNAHSRVGFSVSHMVISEVEGRFTDFEAALKQGKDDFSGSSVEATIKTASVNTSNEMRDKHLRSDDFFNAEKYPTIHFTSTSFEKTGDKSYTIAGNLTIRDVTKPVELKAEMGGPIKDPYGKTRIGFKATTSVNRQDYGVRWSKGLETGELVAGDIVKIDLVFELVKQ